VSGVHDVAAGGLGLALAEMAVRGGVGVHVDGVSGPADLLAEAPGRVVVAVAPERVEAVLAEAASAQVPARRIGTAGGRVIRIDGLVELPLDEGTAAWRDRLPAALDAPVTSA
jgi:phosphoribosylformylglycinamidine synthase